MAAHKGQRLTPPKPSAKSEEDEAASRRLQFGLELRATRVRRHMVNADDFARALAPVLPEQMRVSGSQIRNYEVGKSKPPYPAQVAAMERVLGLPEGRLADILHMERYPHAQLTAERPAIHSDDADRSSVVLSELAALHRSLAAVLRQAESNESQLEALELRVSRLEESAPSPAPAAAKPRSARSRVGSSK